LKSGAIVALCFDGFKSVYFVCSSESRQASLSANHPLAQENLSAAMVAWKDDEEILIAKQRGNTSYLCCVRL